jgi:hypothetical protein
MYRFWKSYHFEKCNGFNKQHFQIYKKQEDDVFVYRCMSRKKYLYIHSVQIDVWTGLTL